MTKKFIKILAIDDNSDNLIVLKALINEAFPGTVYISADSGKKGLALCHTEKPDVILLDIVMPGMDGYEVCAKLKSDSKLRHIPVIMITANRTDKESRVRALEAGADVFLPKPVDESELKAQIRAMLRIKESEDLKREEKQRLEDMVLDRTEALESELADRIKAENKLIQSLDKITRNKQAILNLMEDLKTEMEVRKVMEENLQNERNLLRTLIDNLPDTIYILDKDGRKVIANREDIKNIGCSTEAEVLGKSDLELFPGEVGVRGHSDNMAVINSATPIVDREEDFINREGSRRWLLTSKYPLYDSTGNVKGLFGTGHDITNRKKAEDEINLKNKELGFLYAVSHEIANLNSTDNLNEFLARRLLEFSGAVLAVSLDYIPDKRALKIKYIETKKVFLNKITKLIDNTFQETLIPVDPENLRFILEESFAIHESLNELSFGKISVLIDKAIKSITGINRYYAVANVMGNEYFGTTILAFTEETIAPRRELLVSFARVAAATIQRRNYGEKLRKSEEQYRVLIENQGEGVGIVDLNENFVFTNPAADKMFGMEKGGLLNQNLLNFIVKDHKSIIEKETRKRAKAEKSSYEIDIHRPNGEKRTILITATPQFNNSGKHTGTFGVFRDITERKHMEQKIIESETYYRTLIDISPDGIIISDMEGKVAYVSIKALDIFSVPPDKSVIGTSILSWITPEYHQIVMERVAEIFRGNIIPETREYRLIKYDGSIFWGELSSSPLSDTRGNPSVLMIVCRDISDRKRAETELIKSKEKAEESDRLKTAFLHNISHEIRTPMNAIIGFSALLSEPDNDKDSNKSYIDIITQSSNHLLSIVSDIIEISNIEAGILKIATRKTRLNSVLRNVHNQFIQRAEEKSIVLSMSAGLNDDESVIITDETKLLQILTCILSNAVKFTHHGLIEMGYTIRENFLEFYVRDTGIGISEDQFRKIFERFYQVESSIARQYEGTGLGLSISKAYVELLGGRIWLDSEPGRGTTFYFTIPYVSENQPVVKEVKPSGTDISKMNGTKTILIAEDEENNFLLIEALLSQLNVNIIHAKNGKEAVDICESGTDIHLVVMDIKMPVMDGYEATAILKKIRPAIPVIALTAFAFESDREKALKAGCDDYISKPVRKNQLIELIMRYI
jgi:PAS domain S-box-containing protein